MKTLILSRIEVLEAENAKLTNGTLILMNMTVISELRAILNLTAND